MRIPAATTFLVVLGAAPCSLADAGFTNGFVFPCSSSLNTPLFEGPLEPGQQVLLRTADSCVCIELTYDDFPDSNSSMGRR